MAPAAAASRPAPQPARDAAPSAGRLCAGGTGKSYMPGAALDVRGEPIPAGNLPVEPNAGPVRLAPVQISLNDALELGLRQNPDIVTFRRNEGVAIGVLGVADTYPFNPFVQVNVTPLQTNNGTGSTIYNYVLMMQTIQLAHQQQYREEIGGAALNSVRWNIVQAELLNVAMTERLFFTALYQHGLRDLAIANQSMNDELLGVSTKQFEAGQISARTWRLFSSTIAHPGARNG